MFLACLIRVSHFIHLFVLQTASFSIDLPLNMLITYEAAAKLEDLQVISIWSPKEKEQSDTIFLL